MEVKKCVTPSHTRITRLQGTAWVTNDGDIERVFKQRTELLKDNETDYKLCPEEKPFHDGLVCISCDEEFNLDTEKCT